MILSPSSMLLALWRWFYARYRGLVAGLLRFGPIPSHVGFIMDGNRRYARKSSVERALGHRHGFTKLLDILEWCLELGVSNVTVFAFGEDNFKRSDEEVTELMSLAEEKLWQLLEEPELVARHGICVKVLGNLKLLPEPVQRAAQQVMRATNQYDQVTLNICLAYSSKKEMNKALKAASKVDIVEDRVVVFEHQLGTKGQPPVDLLVRTSGETRLSDFLLWQCATAHLVFSRALWPEFTYLHLLEALLQYQQSVPALAALRSEWEKWLGYSRGSSTRPRVQLNGGPYLPELSEGEAALEAASTEAAHIQQLVQDTGAELSEAAYNAASSEAAHVGQLVQETGAELGQLAGEVLQDVVSAAEAATSSALTHGMAGEVIPQDTPEEVPEGARPTRSHHRVPSIGQSISASQETPLVPEDQPRADQDQVDLSPTASPRAPPAGKAEDAAQQEGTSAEVPVTTAAVVDGARESILQSVDDETSASVSSPQAPETPEQSMASSQRPATPESPATPDCIGQAAAASPTSVNPFSRSHSAGDNTTLAADSASSSPHAPGSPRRGASFEGVRSITSIMMPLRKSRKQAGTPSKSMPLRRQASMMSQGSLDGSEQSFEGRSSTQDREDEIVRAAFTPGQHASMGAETHPDDCPACALAKKMPRHRALSMPMSSAVTVGPSHHLWHHTHHR